MPRAEITLQRERRRITEGLSKDWPITRANRQPRGLDRKLENYCYRHAALQTLLHLPRFLNWIRKHNDPEGHWPCLPTYPNNHLSEKEQKDPILKRMGKAALGCVPCLLKQLIIVYWGCEKDSNVPQKPRPLSWQHSSIYRLHKLFDRKFCTEPEGTCDECKEMGLNKAKTKVHKEKARQDNMKAQQDAEEFISMLFNGITSSINVNDEFHGLQLLREFDALFTLTRGLRTRCLDCDRSKVNDSAEAGPGFFLDLVDTEDTVYAALDRTRTSTITSSKGNYVRCPLDPPCKAPKGVTLDFQRTINAAPEYLRVVLNRNFYDTTTGQPSKKSTAVEIPEVLDLTPHIAVLDGADPAPLRYRLLHGVYHGGTSIKAGHYAAGVTAAPPAPLVEDDETGAVQKNSKGKVDDRSSKYFWIDDATVTGYDPIDDAPPLVPDPFKKDDQSFNATFLFYERIHESDEQNEKEKKIAKKAHSLEKRIKQFNRKRPRRSKVKNSRASEEMILRETAEKWDQLVRKEERLRKKGKRLKREGEVLRKKGQMIEKARMIVRARADVLKGKGNG